MTNPSIRLIEIYNDIDRLLEDGDDQHTSFSRRVREKAESDPVFDRYRDELLLMADMRNLLVHNTYSEYFSPIFSPNEKLIERYEEIRRHILAPDKALGTIATPLAEIYSVTPQTLVLEAVRTMNERDYSHAPVISSSRIIGVFSERSLFAYTALHPGAIDEALHISQLTRDILLSDYKKDRYAFLPRSATVYDVRRAFAAANQPRVLFLTSDGSSVGKLAGMITPTNLLNYKW
ncbi:MAG: CBS domain-containing protein [Eubacteriales bacterium]|nr:CBS domain-containing protein [Eubacteriales bacterium]